MRLTLSIIFIVIAQLLNGQPLIKIRNGSFEKDISRVSILPLSWMNCGFEGYSPPDIHNSASNYWSVESSAYSGQNYLGLVARSDGTFEGICQELSSPLIERGLYKISFSIKTSNKYGSDKEPVFNFADFPLILSIYGCSESCKETELLIETNPVENIDDWLRCDYILHPKRSYEILKLEVRNIDKYPTPYGGNILIDDISDIEVIDTATRIPVSINNQLISLINISARSAKDLDNLIYELIEISKEHNISLQIPNFELIKSIYLSRVVEENLRNQDIRFYLMSIDDNSLREALHSLNLIGYQEMKLIIERGYMLIKKSKDGNISEDELLEFNNLPKEIQDLESGEKYRIEIINSNYDEIVEQLKYCR